MAFSGKGRIETSVGTISPVQLLILAALNRGPAHGYRILKGLRHGLRGWMLKSGTVYPALHRMVEKELITSEQVEHEDRPDAIRYRLTPKGKQLLKEAFQNLKDEFQVQDSVWQFLGPRINGEARAALMNWTMRKRNPIGFAVMRRHCETERCGQIHLEYLKQYREYLKGELDWVSNRLKKLKSSKDES